MSAVVKNGGADRLPPIAPEHWTEEQRRAAQEVIAGARGALVPPFIPLLRSPELMTHAQRMGEYLRYRSAIGGRRSTPPFFTMALTLRAGRRCRRGPNRSPSPARRRLRRAALR